MTKPTITANKNASYEVTGPADIKDSKGTVVNTLKEGEQAWLCRCGHSKNKPFCDGTHNEIGFEAE